jgi:hypothetical protein
MYCLPCRLTQLATSSGTQPIPSHHLRMTAANGPIAPMSAIIILAFHGSMTVLFQRNVWRLSTLGTGEDAPLKTDSPGAIIAPDGTC